MGRKRTGGNLHARALLLLLGVVAAVVLAALPAVALAETWNQAYYNATGQFYLVSTPDDVNVWAAGQLGGAAQLYGTTDGGTTWTSSNVAPPGLIQCWGMSCPSSGTIIYSGEKTASPPTFAMYISHDNGQTWSVDLLAANGMAYPPSAFKFFDALHGYAFAEQGNFWWETLDGGTTWTPKGTLPVSIQYEGGENLSFPTPNVGYALDRTLADIYKTVDAGGHWTKVRTGPGLPWAAATAISFCDVNTGFAITGNPGLAPIKTTDGGATWTAWNSGLIGPLPAWIRCYSPLALTAPGGRRTVDAGQNWTMDFGMVPNWPAAGPASTGWNSGWGSSMQYVSKLGPAFTPLPQVPDSVPPTTTASGIASGWASSPVDVTLTASDPVNPYGPTSGVANTYYALNGGAIQTYSGSPVHISVDGTTTLSYRSVDASGNSETSKTATVRLDTSAPVLGDDHLSKYTAAATVTVSATDTMSGVANLHWRLDGGSWNVTTSTVKAVTTAVVATHTLDYYATDVAGNSSATSTVTFQVKAFVNYPWRGAWTTTQNWNGTFSGAISPANSYVYYDYVASPASDTVYMAGYDHGGSSPGRVVKSTDRAAHWSEITPAGLNNSTTLLLAADKNTPIVFGGDSGGFAVWRSTNAGSTWNKSTVTPAPSSYSVRGGGMVSTTVGYFVTLGGTVYRTSDGGVNWASVSSMSSPDIGSASGMSVISDSDFWVVGQDTGNYPAIWHGSYSAFPFASITWTKQYTGTYTNLMGMSVSFGTSQVGWASSPSMSGSADEQLLKTTNGGATWTKVGNLIPFNPKYITDLRSYNASQVVVMDGFGPHRSSDAGATWTTDTVTPVNMGAGSTPAKIGSADPSYAFCTGTGNYQGPYGYESVTGSNPDTTPPVSTGSAAIGSPNYNGFSKTATVTLSATDPMIPGSQTSGVGSTWYSVDGGPLTLYATPVFLNPAGAATVPVQYFSVDNEGNVEATKTVYASIDTSAPYLSVGSDTRVDGKHYDFVGSAVMNWYLSDFQSRGRTATLTIDGKNSGWSIGWPWMMSGSTISTTAVGDHTAVWTTSDMLGNAATYTVTFTIAAPLDPDTTPPITTPGGFKDSTWTSATPVSVSLTATDPYVPGATTSGIASTDYTLDGEPGGGYTAPFEVTKQGKTDLAFSSVDNATNAETTKTAQVWLDSVAPDTSSDATAAYYGDATITLTPHDATSGLAATWYDLDGAGWTPYVSALHPAIGAHTLAFFSADVAGNVESATVTGFTVFHAPYTVTGDAGPHGSVSPSGPQSVLPGATAIVSVTPDARYHVADVQVDTVSIGASSTVVLADVAADHSVHADFAIDRYTLQGIAHGNGSVSYALPTLVDSGSGATFTIAPDTGYHISDVVVDGVSVGATGTVTLADISQNHTVDAYFEINSYSIEASAGPNGQVDPDGTQTLEYGSSIAFAIMPDSGYVVADVTLDGVSQGAVTHLLIDPVDADHVIHATFKHREYTITPTSGTHGAISPSGPQTVQPGDSATFTITPDAHYHVDGLTVDGVSVPVTGTVLFADVSADHSLAASFAIDTVAIDIPKPPHGSIEPTGPVPYGADVTYTITPDPGYYIVDVTLDGGSLGATDTIVLHNVTTTHTIDATFARYHYTIDATAGAHGAISPSGSVGVWWGDDATFTITPDAHYHVTDVKVDGVSAGATGTVAFRSVKADGHTVSATFAIDTVVITLPTVPHGTIEPTSPVDYGADVTYTVTPDPGYHLVDVTLDGGSIGASETIVLHHVTGPHTIVPTFAIDTFAVTTDADDHGAISPSNPAIDWGTDATFTITPDAHYHVVDVLVDGTSKGAVTSVTLKNVKESGHTIEASFALDTYSIVASAGAHGVVSPTGTQEVGWGTDATFTITPDAHYHIADVTVDGVSVGASDTVVFHHVTGGHTVSATFAIDTVVITLPTVPHGAIEPTSPVDYGADVTYTVTPDPGYHLVDVTLDGGSIGASETIALHHVTGPHTIVPTFAIDTFTVTTSASAHGTLSPSNPTVDWGTDATFTITPDAHAHIVDVKVNGTSVGASESVTLHSVKADHTVSATFALDTLAIDIPTLPHGSITPTKPVDYGTDATFTVTPDPGYHIVDVTLDGGSLGVTDTVVLHNVTTTHTLGATFAIDTFSVVGTAGAHGAISPAGTQTVDWGTDVTYTVTPDAGYHIANVFVDGVSIGATDTIVLHNVTGPRTITVTFATNRKTVYRLWGQTRYDTAIAIARDAYPNWTGVTDLVLASGDDNHQPDAFTGTSLAGALDAPLLLVPSASLSSNVRSAIASMPHGIKVHIIGGTSAVSVKTANAVKALGSVSSIDRIGGATRYDTAELVARRLKSVLGTAFPDTVLITNGTTNEGMFDALIASVASARNHYPVLLVSPTAVPSSTTKALSDLHLTKRYLVGRTASVNENVRKALGVSAGNRISGSTQVGTSVAFAQRAVALGWLPAAQPGFAAAAPDAATGGTYLGKRGGALLLVTPTGVPSVVGSYLTTTKTSIQAGYLFGGPLAVHEPVRTTLEADIN